MKKNDFIFRRKGKTCICNKAVKQWFLLGEPEMERFFSADNQQKIVCLLEQAKKAMRHYREVKAYDDIVEDFTDECASRLYFASELVYRPIEAELKVALVQLFPLTSAHLEQIRKGNALWCSTLKYWVDYADKCWTEMFGHKTDFLPRL